MSEPAYTTGEYEDRPCPKCGEVVEFSELCGIYEGKKWWSCTGVHDAPCGAPCFGAGTGGRGRDGLRLYRTKQYHGAIYPCPQCSEVER